MRYCEATVFCSTEEERHIRGEEQSDDVLRMRT